MWKIFAIAVLFCANALCAHPHVFVDVTVTALFEKSGFVGVHNHWVYDEVYSAAMDASVEKDEKGNYTLQGQKWLEDAIVAPLKNVNYFNYLQMGSSFLGAEKIRNFKASLVNKKLVLDFDVAFTGPLQKEYTMMILVVADLSKYVLMTANMENSDVSAPDEIDVEYFNDNLKGISLFRGFPGDVEGLYIRYKKK